MKGLRTQESKKFVDFFQLVQEKAAEHDAVFFLDAGDGNEFTTPTMEGENLQGWLVPLADVEEFETMWLLGEEDDQWVDFFCWAEWQMTNGTITVTFTH